MATLYHANGFSYRCETCTDFRRLDMPIYVGHGHEGSNPWGDKPTFAIYRDASGKLWVLK